MTLPLKPIVISLSLRGAKQRGVLSLKGEEVPLGCNLLRRFRRRFPRPLRGLGMTDMVVQTV